MERYEHEKADKVLNEETWHVFDKQVGSGRKLYIGAYWKPKGANEKWSSFYCADMNRYGMIGENYETKDAASKALIDLYEKPFAGVIV